MGSLGGMISFLKGVDGNLEKIITNLNKIQNTFNDNFINVELMRNNEVKVLQEKYFKNPESFPEEIKKIYSEEYKIQIKEFDDNLKKISKERDDLEKDMNRADDSRIKFFKKLKSNNKKLDNKEEKLKIDIKKLEAKIVEYNLKIDELNTGFGFIINFFRMRTLQKTKDGIIGVRDDYVERVEEIREKWEEKSSKYSGEEDKYKKEWNELQIKLSLIKEKIEYFVNNKEDIVQKGAFSAVLKKIKGIEKFLISKEKFEKPEKCKRCKSENKLNLFFCRYCGDRFKEDRPDIIGSLIEVGEINFIYNDLIGGIKKSVSFIALLNGLKGGVKKFTESVLTVEQSQNDYASLCKLKIDVPEYSKELSEVIRNIYKDIDVKYYNHHPKDFIENFKDSTETLSADNIGKFFNLMGDELNKTTKSQWG
jgi:hypothetical protein